MTEEDKPKKRKPPQPPAEHGLSMERDSREHLTLFRLDDTVTLDPKTKFTVFPAEKGEGWVLRVYQDPE